MTACLTGWHRGWGELHGGLKQELQDHLKAKLAEDKCALACSSKECDDYTRRELGGLAGDWPKTKQGMHTSVRHLGVDFITGRRGKRPVSSLCCPVRGTSTSLLKMSLPMSARACKSIVECITFRRGRLASKG